jgi:hypothetical protein
MALGGSIQKVRSYEGRESSKKCPSGVDSGRRAEGIGQGEKTQQNCMHKTITNIRCSNLTHRLMPVIYTFNSIATTAIHNRVGTKLEPFDESVGD